MKGLNRITLIGIAGKDAVTTYTPTGLAVTKFSLATEESYKKDGEWKKETEWHNIVAWRELAESASEHVKKGTKLYIEGKVQTRSWDDKQTGAKKYMTEVTASQILLITDMGKPSGKAAPKSEPIADEDIPF